MESIKEIRTIPPGQTWIESTRPAKESAMMPATPAWEVPAGKPDFMIKVRLLRGTIMTKYFNKLPVHNYFNSRLRVNLKQLPKD